MDQSVMDELSRVKIVEPGNENKFRKKQRYKLQEN